MVRTCKKPATTQKSRRMTRSRKKRPASSIVAIRAGSCHDGILSEQARTDLWKWLMEEMRCEMCRHTFKESYHEHCIQIKFKSEWGADERLCCPGCTAHIVSGMCWRYEQPMEMFSITQRFARHMKDSDQGREIVRAKLPPDHVDMNERMCGVCQNFLVAVYIKCTYYEPTYHSFENECCYWCAAKCLLDMHVGLAHMWLDDEPQIYEVTI